MFLLFQIIYITLTLFFFFFRCSYLYVPGQLANKDKLIVDVGTGYYVEKVRNINIFYIYIYKVISNFNNIFIY